MICYFFYGESYFLAKWLACIGEICALLKYQENLKHVARSWNRKYNWKYTQINNVNVIQTLQYSMRTSSKEDYMDSDKASRDTKNSTQISQIDKILNQMQSTYRAHIEAQQCYIDILKRNNKNINSKYIKYIYGLFSQNKANQICFQKEWEKIIQFELSEKVIRRYYARMIQIVIRKVSYFWMNSSTLQFLSSHIIKLMRVIRTCFNQIHKIKGLQFHFKVLKMLFHENSLIEQKIYELLIDQGYLISMDEFYRINGVDLVADRQYHRKTNTKLQSPSIEDSQQDSFIKKQQNSIKSKTKSSKDSKRVWGQNKVETPILSLNQLQKNKTKIKDMLESIVKVLKVSAQQQKQTLSQLEVIQEQNEQVSKTQRENLQLKEESGQMLDNQIKTKKRLSSVVVPEIRKRLNEKKISIQLMSYFSKEFKSVLSEPQQVDINCISELLIARESNSKSLPTAYIKMNSNQPSYIHSLKSFESMQRIRQQKKRGKLIEMAVKMKNEQALSQMCQQMNDNSHIQFRPSYLRQKFSFRSTPGVYISVPKRKESRMKIEQKKTKKSYGINKFLIRQNLGKQNIFQNELIVNQLASREAKDLRNKINYTEINGDSLLKGVLSPKVANRKIQQNSIEKIESAQNKNDESQKQQRDKLKCWLKKSKLINKTDYKVDKKEQVNSQEQRNKSVLQKSPSSNRFSYTIYDRLRRRILPR